MKFLCPHCENGAMRIVAVAGSTVRIECLRCGRESVLETEATAPGAADQGPAGGPRPAEPGGQVAPAGPAAESFTSAPLPL
ncbi:MAG TPA: hypothetical protein VLV76_16070 [Candidatus Acidoferrum sp.]|nr:hypothetical protein [Candidatus Acidoferrum sp.]